MNPLIIQLLLAVGGSLGASLVKNPGLQQSIAAAVNASENLVTLLTGKSGQDIAGPVFITVLQAAIAVLVAEKKISADEATALQNAIQAAMQADIQGQQVVDPGTIATPIAPLP